MLESIMRLRAAHERNDEVLERNYIGRSFRNDTAMSAKQAATIISSKVCL